VTLHFQNCLTGFPELGNTILTFKDVSEELQQDSGIQVGIFILRSGVDIFYVPVVGKDNNVYPIDSIFFNSKQKFFPLTKKTIAVILNSSQLTQGKPKKIPTSVVTNPDLKDLMVPPRTPKFAQASASRLGDFMASMPNALKEFTLEKFAEEKSVYENLHKLFAIKDIFEALQVKPKSLAAVTNEAPISIVTGASSGLTGDEISSILNDGYHVRGEQPSHRVAMSVENFEDGKFSNIQELDGGSDYEVMFTRGNSREAFIPKMIEAGQHSGNPRQTVALFTNGDYSVSSTLVAKGTKLDRTAVLDIIFNFNPPVLPRDVVHGDTFAILDVNANLLGVFTANSVVQSHLGVEISVYARAGFLGSYKICAYRNYGLAPSVVGKDIFLPYSSLVLKLSEDISMDLERSVIGADKRHKVTMASMLGEQIDLSYDGVEFAVNRKAIGQEKEAMQRLVVEEGIDPVLALSFVKQAKEKKSTKIYLTKRAAQSFEAGQIASFGEQPQPQGKTGLNGSFIPNVQKSLTVGDAQSTEATIISELLQEPEMYSLIGEYVPDIEECIDKLGRILFLSRIHITQLSENNDTDSVFAFLASLKNVYKMLGDNLIKLQELVALKPNEKK